MPTFASDVKPTTTGLALGAANQKWIGYLSNIFADTIQSNSPNQALTGTIRLASLDSISWRNAANTADVTLSKTNAASTTTPADTLVFNGSGIEGPFLSHNINPASTGEVRLSTGDGIYFRNNANSGDVAGLVHNADDTVTLGGSAGSSTAAFTATSVTTPTVTGNTALTLQAVSGGAVTVTGANGTSGGNVNINTGTGSAGAGGNLAITVGNGSTNGGIATILGGSGTSGNGGGVAILCGNGSTGNSGGSITLNGGTAASGTKGTIQTNTTVATYNNIATVGSGIPYQVGAIDLTAQTTAITTSNFYNPPVTGWFRISAYLKITTAGTSPVLGPITIGFTDGTDSVAQSVIMSCQTQAGVAQATGNSGNTTTSVLIGTLPIWAKAGVIITYAIALTGTVGAGAFEAHLRIESL